MLGGFSTGAVTVGYGSNPFPKFWNTPNGPKLNRSSLSKVITTNDYMRLCKKEYWHLVLICPLVWFSGKKGRTKKIRFTYMPNIWPDSLAFGLNRSIIGDENSLGKWLSDPKKATPWKRSILVCQNRFFPLPELVPWKGQGLKKWFSLANNRFSIFL